MLLGISQPWTSCPADMPECSLYFSASPINAMNRETGTGGGGYDISFRRFSPYNPFFCLIVR